MVKSAGDYQLTVTDSCGNTKSDMIHVDYKTSLPIDLGGTRNICPTDTVGISLPVGGNPFNLTPYYNILPSPGGALYFFPRKDTVYTLVVNEAGGCQRSGQLAFKIFPSRNSTWVMIRPFVRVALQVFQQARDSRPMPGAMEPYLTLL